MQHVVFLYLLAEAANFLRKWNVNAQRRTGLRGVPPCWDFEISVRKNTYGKTTVDSCKWNLGG
jgi:hypothetical protein